MTKLVLFQMKEPKKATPGPEKNHGQVVVEDAMGAVGSASFSKGELSRLCYG